MNWLILVLIAYFLNALVFIIDKYLLLSKITQPLIYASYLGFLSLLSVFLIPFDGLIFPGFFQLIVNLASGAFYILALMNFYSGLKEEEPSRVVPIIGSLVSIFTLLLSYFLINERLKGKVFLGVLLLIIGGFLIAIKKFSISKVFLKNFSLWLLTSFLFALSYVLMKYAFVYQSFIGGFVLSRVGAFLTTLGFLSFPQVRKEIFKTTKNIKINTSFLYLANQAISSISFIILNYAIFLTSVSLVNTLQSVQYAFVFILVLFLGNFFPKIKEENTPLTILQKIVSLILISLGLKLIFI
jgi:drug/metabolite transporter (DMT)-like permease